MSRKARWPGRHRPSGMDWIHRSTRMAIYERDGHKCVVCGSAENLSLDHIDDVRGNVPENLVTACSSCNSSRGDLPIEEAYGEEVAHRAATLALLPLDRSKGRELAKARWPERFARQRASTAAWRKKLDLARH